MHDNISSIIVLHQTFLSIDPGMPSIPMTDIRTIVTWKRFAYLSTLKHKKQQSDTDAAKAMEVVKGVRTIRLRTRKNKYLTAGSDEESVRQDRNGSTDHSRWTVEFVDGKTFIRLKSCFGKYLTATNEPLVPRAKGHKVLQKLPSRLNSSTEWEIEMEGSKLRLKTCHGQYLRPYGGVPPIRNMVGHDVPTRSKTEAKILWDLEVVERCR